uniref:Uncharacterized protein n=1 Tax=Caudovirales sp. ctVfb8 TaxID=2825766 RepID=A0A8S5V3F4_9CAUD|nr:MAG TPA: hypothetical protein [Caudovirales sp. ctVfb8]DAH04215.1 MAG TPA: hypothetical protein [Caudoviricetes sp.]DAL53572.1 MAG TPA_asm: hypothetical protein [Bacteriophage sp.]DAM93734.1 MAG TPA: hypothetical protein [Caudoviricetes sp.]
MGLHRYHCVHYSRHYNNDKKVLGRPLPSC